MFRPYSGFMQKGPKLDGGPEVYFRDVLDVMFVLKNTLYNSQTLILDGVVVSVSYVLADIGCEADA